MNIGWRTKYILALSEDFFNTPLEALRNHGPSPWFSFPHNKNKKRALPKPGKLSSKRLCLFFVVFETVFLVEAVHTAIGLREFLTSSIEWV